MTILLIIFGYISIALFLNTILFPFLYVHRIKFVGYKYYDILTCKDYIIAKDYDKKCKYCKEFGLKSDIISYNCLTFYKFIKRFFLCITWPFYPIISIIYFIVMMIKSIMNSLSSIQKRILFPKIESNGNLPKIDSAKSGYRNISYLED